MIQPRTAIGILLRFVGIYLLLVLPWPGLGTASGAVTRFGAGMVSGRLPGLGAVRHEALAPEAPVWSDIRMVLFDRAGRQIGERRVNSRHLAFLPMATMLALVLATPLGRRARFGLGGAGLGLTALFVAGRITLSALQGFNDAGALAGWHTHMRALLWRSEAILVSLPSSWFLEPILVWGLLLWIWDERGGERVMPSVVGRGLQPDSSDLS